MFRNASHTLTLTHICCYSLCPSKVYLWNLQASSSTSRGLQCDLHHASAARKRLRAAKFHSCLHDACFKFGWPLKRELHLEGPKPTEAPRLRGPSKPEASASGFGRPLTRWASVLKASAPPNGALKAEGSSKFAAPSSASLLCKTLQKLYSRLHGPSTSKVLLQARLIALHRLQIRRTSQARAPFGESEAAFNRKGLKSLA